MGRVRETVLLAEVTRLRAENQRLGTRTQQQEECLAELQTRVQYQDAHLRELSAHAEAQQQEIEYLRQLCEEYRRKIYGRSSERLQDGQLLLEFGEDGKAEEASPPPHVEEAPTTRGRRTGGRRARTAGCHCRRTCAASAWSTCLPRRTASAPAAASRWR